MKNAEHTFTFLFLCGLTLYSAWMLIFDTQPFLINALNILFHEAGHFIFSFFGRFIMILGGTLGQLLMPMIFIYYFHNRFQIPGKIFSLWWLSTSLYDISIYAGDAQERILPLITDDPYSHDWWNMLSMLGILKYDDFVSGVFIILALCVTVYMGYLTYEYWKQKEGAILS